MKKEKKDIKKTTELKHEPDAGYKKIINFVLSVATELKHDPESGYRKIFNIVLSVMTIYLCIIFVLGFALG